MKERIAILDLGTNTFNLLIAEKTTTGINMIHQSKEISRLGEGGIHKKEIIPIAFERGVNALIKHRSTIDDHSCTKIIAFGTSAIRDAENGKSFTEKVREETGINVEIINGEREAELIWEGARKAIQINETSLIMDIGGGSVEFIIGDDEKTEWRKSLPIGVSRLKESFPFSDPATDLEANDLISHLQNDLKELAEKCNSLKIKDLIGCSGSFDSYADMICFIHTGKSFNNSEYTHFHFDLTELNGLLGTIITTDNAQRQQIQGLSPMRRDFIVYGAILTQLVLEKCRIKNVFLSAYSLKEGVFFSELGKK